MNKGLFHFTWPSKWPGGGVRRQPGAKDAARVLRAIADGKVEI